MNERKRPTKAGDVSFIREAVDRSYIRRVLEELIAIPSHSRSETGAEEQAAQYLAQRMKELNMRVHTQAVETGMANAVGILEGEENGPSIILNGHLDVVPVGEGWRTPPFEPAVREGMLYGRGAADMKGAIAAMLGAVKLIRDHNLSVKGQAHLAFVCDEEAHNRGVARYLSDGPRADFAIVGEPTGLQLTVAHRGLIRFDITVYGRAGHIGRPQGTVNAIDRMSPVLEAVRDLNRVLGRKEHGLLPPASIGTTLIRGGIKDNMVPGQCSIVVDRRLLPGENDETARGEIESIMASIKEDDPDFRCDFRETVYMPPGEADCRGSQMEAVQQLHRACFGGQAVLHGFDATCEQVCFLGSGINTIICGPGHIREAHTANEYVELEQVYEAAVFYAWCLMNSHRLKKDGQ